MTPRERIEQSGFRAMFAEALAGDEPPGTYGRCRCTLRTPVVAGEDNQRRTMTKFISFALPDDAEIVSWPLWGFSGEVEYDDATEVKTWEQLGAKWVSIDGCSWSVAAEGYPHGKLEARVQRSKSDSWNVTLYHPTDRWGSKSFYIGETDLEARLFIQTLQEMPQEL